MICFIAYFVVVWQPSTSLELIPVEAGVEDRGALSSSFRSAPVDLRQDQSFEQLYRVAGQDGVYVRRSGGLYAVFKNPTYIDTRWGSIPTVPAGTVYSIGAIQSEMLGQLDTLASPVESDSLVHNEVDGFALQSQPRATFTGQFTPMSTDGVRFLEDEPYRRQKLALLVLKIVLAEQ
tara:strand:- start:4582 stop:5112 length:531 start_codon:yes stop_codon:yes gene_type:complete